MALIQFTQPDIQYEVADGTALLDLPSSSPLLFGCRSASCATCLIEVHEGAENLSPMRADEKELLVSLGYLEGHRLACQTKILRGTVKIHVPD